MTVGGLAHRRQAALLLAIHRNELRMDLTRQRAEAWIDNLENDPNEKVLDALNFDALIRDADALFGADPVHVAVYEDMRQRPERVAETLARPCGSRSTDAEPTSTCPRSMPVARRISIS